MDLILLTGFFYDQKIEWWESGLLLVMYILYCTFMTLNPSIEAKAKGMTEDEVKAMHGNDGDDDEEGEQENAEEGDDTPKRPEDRYPTFGELFLN